MTTQKPFDENLEYTEFIMQDGVRCPRKPPWDKKVSKITGLPFILIILLAVNVLFQAGFLKLVIWVSVFGFFAYPLRYLICARCPYYGMNCSTSMGKIVPKMFKKQDGKSMKFGLYMDILCFTFLFLYPLPAIWELKGILFLLAWCGAFMLMLATLYRLACSICPFTFCPVGRCGKAIWG